MQRQIRGSMSPKPCHIYTYMYSLGQGARRRQDGQDLYHYVRSPGEPQWLQPRLEQWGEERWAPSGAAIARTVPVIFWQFVERVGARQACEARPLSAKNNNVTRRIDCKQLRLYAVDEVRGRNVLHSVVDWYCYIEVAMSLYDNIYSYMKLRPNSWKLKLGKSAFKGWIMHWQDDTIESLTK